MSDPTPALSKEFTALIATPNLPALGPGPRPDRLAVVELEARLTRFFVERQVPVSLHPWLRSAALLWHDHLEASHELSQQIDGPDGSFLHGLMHRREPDYGNAKYWFHRVGRHEAFREMARQTTRHLVREKHHAWLARLAPNGLWDPFAFIDACEQAAAAGESDSRQETLQRLQEIEFQALLEHVLDAGAAGASPGC